MCLVPPHFQPTIVDAHQGGRSHAVSSIGWKSLSEFGAFVDVDLSDDLPSSVIEELVELYQEHR
jgi:hypothetical protein